MNPNKVKKNNATTLWIARDMDGELYLYSSKPQIIENGSCSYFFAGNGIVIDTMIKLPSTLFSNVTFANSPLQVKVSLQHNTIQLQ